MKIKRIVAEQPEMDIELIQITTDLKLIQRISDWVHQQYGPAVLEEGWSYVPNNPKKGKVTLHFPLHAVGMGLLIQKVLYLEDGIDED